MALFRPEEFLTRITQVDLDALAAQGIECLLLDLDNTLLPRDTKVVPQDIREWIEQARFKGFKLYLVSNNWHSSVFADARELGLPIIHKSMKPFPLAYAIARRRVECTRKNSIAIGDQLMTDVLGAHLSFMKAILLLPLAQKDLAHTLFLRKVERKLLRGATPSR